MLKSDIHGLYWVFQPLTGPVYVKSDLHKISPWYSFLWRKIRYYEDLIEMTSMRMKRNPLNSSEGKWTHNHSQSCPLRGSSGERAIQVTRPHLSGRTKQELQTPTMILTIKKMVQLSWGFAFSLEQSIFVIVILSYKDQVLVNFLFTTGCRRQSMPTNKSKG